MRAWDGSYNRETHETLQVWWWSMVAHNCHGKTKNLTAKTKTSRQKQKPHGKNKNITAKPKTSQAKTKYLTAKPNTSQQKQNSFGFAVGICFCYEVFVFCCGYLLLSWGFCFCREVFWFCCEVFCFCHDVFGFAVTVVGHRSGQKTVSTILQLFYRMHYITEWLASHFKNLFTFFLEKRWVLFFFSFESVARKISSLKR